MHVWSWYLLDSVMESFKLINIGISNRKRIVIAYKYIIRRRLIYF